MTQEIMAAIEAAKEESQAAEAVAQQNRAALAAVCGAAKSLCIWSRIRVAQGWSNLADPNARGGDDTEEYFPSPLICVRPFGVTEVGAQNSGGYALSDGGLYVDSAGRLYHAVNATGSWSHWQGSSGGWSVEIGRYTRHFSSDDLEAALAVINATIATARAVSRAKKERGAALATRVLMALAPGVAE